LPFEILTPSSTHIQEFKALYKKRFDKELSDIEALQQLMSLLTIVRYRQLERSKESLDNQVNIRQNLQATTEVVTKKCGTVDQLLKEMQIEIIAGS
jgi:hypothetical protein